MIVNGLEHKRQPRMNGKRFQWLLFITLIAAGVCSFIGIRFSLPPFNFLALILLGITSLLAGIQVVVKKEAFFLPRGERASRRRSELYSGLAAQLWGIIFILFGLGLLLGGAAALFIPEQAQATVDRLFDSAAGWGILLIVLGVLAGLYGLTRLLSGAAAVSRRMVWRNAGYRLLGGFLLLLGIALVAVGVLLLTSPETLVEFLMRLFAIP